MLDLAYDALMRIVGRGSRVLESARSAIEVEIDLNLGCMGAGDF